MKQDAPSKSSQGKWKRLALRSVVALGLAYILACLVVFVFQRNLIYFPTAFSRAVADSIAAREGLLPWENSRGELIGWKLKAKTNSSGSILIMHGNAGSAVQRGYIAYPAHKAAMYDVYILEYPGYGSRPGAPSKESILAAADEAFAELAQRPVYLVSESIGTGAAAYLAKSHPDKIRGLVMFVPYDDLASAAQHKMWWLPARLLLKDRYQPAEWLKEYRGPVKIVLAAEDEIVPVDLGKRLYDGYAGPKQLEVVPNARHNDPASQTAEWWTKVFTFLGGSLVQLGEEGIWQ